MIISLSLFMKKIGFVDLDKYLSVEELTAEWYPKICFFVRQSKLPQPEDLIQELMLHLFEVTKKFNLGKSAFTTFAWTCLRNKLRTIIKQLNRKEFFQSNDGFSWTDIEFEIDYNTVLLGLNQQQQFVISSLNKGYKKSEIARKLKVRESRVSGLLKELSQKKILGEILNV